MPPPNALMAERIMHRTSIPTYVGSNPTGRANIQEIHMLQFLKRLFCIHAYDYESDIFNQAECRKCGKCQSDS